MIGAALLALALALSVRAGYVPPQPPRLARSLPPEVIAMVASNAPAHARIRIRYYRAMPYDPARGYKPGDVVLNADGRPYIAVVPVFPVIVQKFRVEALLRDDSATPIHVPPAWLFREINQKEQEQR